MKLSVVVPSYNQARFLRATLESILSQARPGDEVLVFDGGSTDGSVEILREYDGRIFWVSQKDHGQADAINRGLHRATGDILAYLNSDDVYLPGALEAMRAHFRDHPGALALYGRAHHLKEGGEYLEDYPTEPWDFARLQETCFLCQPATFWRREAMERFGIFDPALHYAMDYEYWLRLGKHFAFDYLEAGPPLAGSRLHGDTKTLSARVKVHREILRVVQRHGGSPAAQQGWLRHLAHHRATEALPEPRTSVQQREFILRWAAFVLLYAEEFEIPLDDAALAALEPHLAHAGI